MLITASFFISDKLKGKKYSVALSQPAGMKFEELDFLKPTWKIVSEYKCTSMSWQEYSTEYFKILDNNATQLQKLIDTAMTEDIVLCCWEPTGKLCHRQLIAQYIVEKLNFSPFLVKVL